jgi:hypothetical protein
MNKKLTLELDQKLMDRIRAQCQGDEKAIREFIAQAIEHELDRISSNKSEPTPGDLEDYLKKGHTGSRTYGVKGQGW